MSMTTTDDSQNNDQPSTMTTAVPTINNNNTNISNDNNNGDTNNSGMNVAPPQDATRRLQTKKQTLDDAYAVPANFLEIDVCNPITHGVARNRYTDYEVRMRVCVSPSFLSSISFNSLNVHTE